MHTSTRFEVIIIGGSYAGLAAAMALARAMKQVLIIDSGKPCNQQTPYSHNFLTQDGQPPASIAATARQQALQYPTVQWVNDVATTGTVTADGFAIHTASDKVYYGTKLIFATGLHDRLPAIDGLQACWGITALHCPYCHGYEVRQQNTAILGQGNVAFDLARLLYHWAAPLTIFTNGAPNFSPTQQQQLAGRNIRIVEKEIAACVHNQGKLTHLRFHDSTTEAVTTLYLRSPLAQHCPIPEALGCAVTEGGYLQIDATFETTVPGVYACGDNASGPRTVANAVATGTATGMALSKKMIIEQF